MDSWGAYLTVVFLSVMVFNASPTGMSAMEDRPEDDCIPHDQIMISGVHEAQGFTLGNDPATGQPIYRPESGVTAGTGTPEDPYIIEGWCIIPFSILHTTAPPVGIIMDQTDEHVLIRENYIHLLGEFYESAGILLTGASNVTLSNNQLDHHFIGTALTEGASGNTLEENSYGQVRHGITVARQSNGNTIRGNTIQSDGIGVGISISESGNNVIMGNQINETGSMPGIDLFRSHTNTIQENQIDEGNGINLFESDNNTFEKNLLQNLDTWGIMVNGDDNEIRHNTIANNLGGVWIIRSNGTMVEENNIHGNEEAGLNTHDVPVPVDARNNWWGCASGPGDQLCDEVNGDVVYEPWLEAPWSGSS